MPTLTKGSIEQKTQMSHCGKPKNSLSRIENTPSNGQTNLQFEWKVVFMEFMNELQFWDQIEIKENRFSVFLKNF